MKNYNIPIFIPELACPFQCIYCNQKNISDQLTLPTFEQIRNTIETHLRTMDLQNSIIQIAFFGGNFTGIDISLQDKYLSIANEYVQKYKLNGIRLSTRPDYINEEILSLLKKYNVKAIELGAQSLDDEVLKKVGRGHTTKDVETASKLINDFGFELGLQMMIGLPGDTELASIKTAQKIIELKAKSTRIYPTLVIKDTSLEKLYHKGQYQPLSLHDAIQITKKIIPIFENNKIQILRVGLHPSEGLVTGKNLVAGPFHPSFKELVLTEIWYDKFTEHFKQDEKYKEIKIFVNPKEYNYAVGYRGKNKIYLSNLAKQVKFYPSEFIYNRNLQVEIIK
jgi:radical SAM enzyme (TIGR01210 family)